MPIYQAQSKGEMYIGASKVKAAYQGNKLVYSSGKEVNEAKNAPPFLSAGWKTIKPYKEWEGDIGWSLQIDLSDSVRKQYIKAKHYWQSKDTLFINETNIDIYIHLIVESLDYSIEDSYLFHSPSFEIGSVSKTSFESIEEFGDYDNGSCYRALVIRYSNNRHEWTEWYTGSGFLDKSYKYAQVGYFISCQPNYNDVDKPSWNPDQGWKMRITGCSFN